MWETKVSITFCQKICILSIQWHSLIDNLPFRHNASTTLNVSWKDFFLLCCIQCTSCKVWNPVRRIRMLTIMSLWCTLLLELQGKINSIKEKCICTPECCALWRVNQGQAIFTLNASCVSVTSNKKDSDCVFKKRYRHCFHNFSTPSKKINFPGVKNALTFWLFYNSWNYLDMDCMHSFYKTVKYHTSCIDTINTVKG